MTWECEGDRGVVDYYATLLQQNSEEGWFARVKKIS